MEEIQKEVDGVLEDQNTVRYTQDGEMIRHFDRLLQDAEVQKIKNGEKIEPALGECLLLKTMRSCFHVKYCLAALWLSGLGP